jgi:hypothetical protein
MKQYHATASLIYSWASDVERCISFYRFLNLSILSLAQNAIAREMWDHAMSKILSAIKRKAG